MTQSISSNVPKCFHIIHHKWKTKNKINHEDRIEFFDPYGDSTQSLTKQAALLNFQVYRLRRSDSPASQEYSNEIRGIKIHSKAIHILCQVIYFISMQNICKSFSVKLMGKVYYLNLNSYNKWRDQNGDALGALGVVVKSDRKHMPQARTHEIAQLVQLLSTPKNDRPKLEQSITTGLNAFDIAERALKIADQKISLLKRICTTETLEKTRYELAAYYILVVGRIEMECSEVLRISHQFVTRNSSITDQEAVRLTQSNPKDLQENDKEKAQTIHKALNVNDEDIFGVSRIKILRTQTDLFQDVNQGTYPIEAKKLLNQLIEGDDAFYKTFANLIASPIRGFPPVFSSEKEQALYEHIQSLGKAMRSQFTSKNTNIVMLSALKSGVKQLAKKGLLTEENVYEYGRAFSTLAAWRLLSSATAGIDLIEKKKRITCQSENEILSFTFPKDQFVLDSDKTTYHPAYLTPLSGYLHDDGTTKGFAAAEEIYDCIQTIASLNSYEKKILENLVYKRRVKPFTDLNKKLKKELKKNPEGDLDLIRDRIPQLTSQMITQQIWSKVDQKTMDQGYFNYLVKLCETIEGVGNLIRSRYWEKLGYPIIESFQFQSGGNIDRSQLKKCARIDRNPQEHKHIIDTYFKDIPYRHLIDLPKRTKPPRFTSEELQRMPKKASLLSGAEKKALVSNLYFIPHSFGEIGNCCLGAIAQGLFGKSLDPVKMIWTIDHSRDSTLLNNIRKAICQYMLNNPREVSDFVGCRLINAHNQTYETPEQAVQRRAGELSLPSTMRVDPNTWISSAEFPILSLLIGRPIHVISFDHLAINKKGAFEAEKFGDQFNTEPLVLLHQVSHYDILFKKRNGIERIT